MESIIEKNVIIDTVTDLFIYTDQKNWEQVVKIFSEQVLLDYTSMGSEKPELLSPQKIMELWKSLLPGFESTHHQISNFRINIQEDQADCSCYGIALHYLPFVGGDPIFTVVGTYLFHLQKVMGGWKIDRMKFNLKFTQGNNNLPELAQEKIKNASQNSH